MFKSILLTAIVGYATAKTTLFSWSDTYNPTLSSGVENYVDVFFKYDVDASYGSDYIATAPDASTETTENYGARVWSWVNGTMEIEWFRSYKHQIMVSLIPFDVTPYAQQFYYTYSPTFTMGGRGWRNVRLGDIFTTVTENAQTCTQSVEQGTATNTWSTTCSYDPTTQNDFIFEDLSYNYFENGMGYLAENDATNTWWGVQYYYDQQFF